MKKLLLAFAVFYLLCFIVQGVGGYFTQLTVNDWYVTLTKSELTPPGYVFGIAWTILYFLMAAAAARIQVRTGWRTHAMACWLIQLLLGLAWTMLFFGHKEIALGFVVILANLVAVAVTLRKFHMIDRFAGCMLVPLLLWLTFASYLNGFILLNH